MGEAPQLRCTHQEWTHEFHALIHVLHEWWLTRMQATQQPVYRICVHGSVPPEQALSGQPPTDDGGATD